MSVVLSVILGILPSLAWLAFYLRKDSHPESNLMVVKIFLWGMIAPLPIVMMELGFYDISQSLNLEKWLVIFLNAFIGIAFSEEFVKYLIVRSKAIYSSELDEPIDVVLYMIIASLGFAASENIIMILRINPLVFLPEAIFLAFVRFLGATFLHGLCAGVVGFFTAMAYLETKKHTRFIVIGLTTAIFLHGLYNFSIMVLGNQELGMANNIGVIEKLAIPLTILIGLAIFVNAAFKKVKKMKSVCF
jgi:RsiW-degrading membrane proteinase PrsW (M82 family)